MTQVLEVYERDGFTVKVLRSSKSRPRSLSVSKPNKIRTKRAKRQGHMGSVPYMRVMGGVSKP